MSIPILQHELRALCLSSPPSLHTSPIHGSSGMGNNPASISNSSATSSSLPPSSPPLTLPQISEETHKIDIQEQYKSISQQSQHRSCRPHHQTSVPLITPPQSFRSSPVTSPNHAATPSISVTDELGASQFPILPPPIDFRLAVTNSHPNLDQDSSNVSSKVTADFLFNRLHRWRNDETLESAARESQCMTMDSQTHHQTMANYPSYPNLMNDDHLSVHGRCNNDQQSTFAHYTSVPCVLSSKQLTTTDSGSICINDRKTAAKLLSHFGHDQQLTNCRERHVLTYGHTQLQISIEWNQLQQKLILKHVSGDASQYQSLCHELISTII
ncbi:hypothetical protein BLA29_005879 [Euroglyphus maynei]|uniref:Uncharacterized protein n=1 Tax=Euroglyphus maynei TaxID=6958 RepID=A0A1Y3B7G2_EURMA|nr:hypothetical protein BLA29_005879 [Euroglyphus maynei]